MTTTVLHTNKFSMVKIIVQFHPWLQIAFIVPATVTYSCVVVSEGIIHSFSVLLEMAIA